MALTQVVGTPDLLENILARFLVRVDRVVDEWMLSELHSVSRTSRAFRDGVMALLVKADQEGGADEWLSRVELRTSFEWSSGAYTMLAALAPCVTKLSVTLRAAKEDNTLLSKFLSAKLSLFRRLRYLKLMHHGMFAAVQRPLILWTLPTLRNLVEIDLDLRDAAETWDCFQCAMVDGSLQVTHLRVCFSLLRSSSREFKYHFNWPRSKVHTLCISFDEGNKLDVQHLEGKMGRRELITGLHQIATMQDLTIRGHRLTVQGLPPRLDALHLKGLLYEHRNPRGLLNPSEDTDAMIGRSPPRYMCLISYVGNGRSDDDSDLAPLLQLPLTKFVASLNADGSPRKCVCCHLHNGDIQEMVEVEILRCRFYRFLTIYDTQGSKLAIIDCGRTTTEQVFERLRTVL